MKYKTHVAWANREDLTREALESATELGNFYLWPNNGAAPLNDMSALQYRVLKQTVLPPVSAVAMINLAIQSSWDDDVMFWMHNDAFCKPGVARQFYEDTLALKNSDRKWGVHFTHYDVLCAFNMRMVREVGYWDPMFFQYTSDLDWYERVKRAGWEMVNNPLGYDGVEHRGSMTVRSDSTYNHAVQWRERDGFDKRYYIEKWGGSPTHEKFKTPFDRG